MALFEINGVVHRYPVSVFRLTFTGDAGKTWAFGVAEDKSSREINPQSILVYDVTPLTPSDNQWTYDIDLPQKEGWEDRSVSEELIIAANVWRFAGYTHMSSQMIKKWPPSCTRTGPNRFRVTINYEQLFTVNLQVAPVRTKRLTSLDVLAWRASAAGWDKVDIPAIADPKEKRSYLNIHVDKKGVVGGVDTFDPSFAWSERWVFGPIEGLDVKIYPDPDIKTYEQIVTTLSGTVNDYLFRGFPRGSVLFRGGTGRNIFPLTWEFDYDFLYMPSRKKMDTGWGYSEINIPNTPEWAQWGHTYVDVEEMEPMEGSSFDITNTIKVLKLHKIYEVADFSWLGLAEYVPFGCNVPFSNDDKYFPKGFPNDRYLEGIVGKPWVLPEWAEYSVP